MEQWLVNRMDKPQHPTWVPLESPRGNLQLDDLPLTDADNADGDCTLSTPFNTSAMAVLKHVSEAYSGDAYFPPENAATREKMEIVEVVDQAQPESQHALTNDQHGPAKLWMRDDAIETIYCGTTYT